MKKLMNVMLLAMVCVGVSSCALGAGTAATAGYSLTARTAEGLSADAESRLEAKLLERMKTNVTK